MAARKTKKAELDTYVPTPVNTDAGKTPTAADLKLDELRGIKSGLFEVAKAIREVGLAMACWQREAPSEALSEALPPASGLALGTGALAGTVMGVAPGLVGQTRDADAGKSRAAAVSLPPTPTRGQGEHGGGPKSSESVPSQPKPRATLQQAQKAVLDYSAKNGAQATAAILQGLGVTRVSAITGDDAPGKYAEVVAALVVK